jgi:DNA-binding CsgD family transcriptional regulator
MRDRRRIALSPRQTEIARLLGDGLTQDEIGQRLGIATRTVEVHVGLIRAKTGRPSTLSAIVDLVRLGLV